MGTPFILKKSLNATFCFSGHIHQNTYSQVDGTFHFTQQSLTETFAIEGKITNSMGLIEIDEKLDLKEFNNLLYEKGETKIKLIMKPVSYTHLTLPTKA